MRSVALPKRPARSHRSVLSVQPLEGRLVPADVLASVSPLGLLTITGDAEANDLTLTVTATSVTLTPNGGGTVNGSATAAVLGAVKSIKADLRGGDDVLSIDSTAGFRVTGLVSIALGDGTNVLNLSTSGRIELGALTVKGADGEDSVTVQGGAGLDSVVTGAALFNYAGGGSTTVLSDVRFGIGVTVTATDGVGIPNTVTGTNLTVAKAVVANLGNSFPSTAHFVDSAIGGLKGTGNAFLGVLQNTAVNGSVNVKGVFQAGIEAEATTVSGNVSLIAPNPNFSATGAGTTINGNLVLNGLAGWTSTSFQTTTLSEVKGNVTVTGGWFNDMFETNSQLRVGKNATFTLNGGDNLVAIGDGNAAVTFGGNLKYKGGAGLDSVFLNRVTLTGLLPLTGTTSILTLGGNDFLSIENGSSFAKAFTADLGSGNDTISLAQNIGSAAAVTFSSTTRIVAGFGDDTLLLGLEPTVLGDANTRVVFSGPTSLVEGGDGMDSFDPSSGQFTGATPTGW